MPSLKRHRQRHPVIGYLFYCLRIAKSAGRWRRWWPRTCVVAGVDATGDEDPDRALAQRLGDRRHLRWLEVRTSWAGLPVVCAISVAVQRSRGSRSPERRWPSSSTSQSVAMGCPSFASPRTCACAAARTRPSRAAPVSAVASTRPISRSACAGVAVARRHRWVMRESARAQEEYPPPLRRDEPPDRFAQRSHPGHGHERRSHRVDERRHDGAAIDPAEEEFQRLDRAVVADTERRRTEAERRHQPVEEAVVVIGRKGDHQVGREVLRKRPAAANARFQAGCTVRRV
ncbi:Uncharacterised protein [Actinomadura madurae]|nr:Uncharacterised protein [Actinomadura madurae]